jgi:hypothetical protein
MDDEGFIYTLDALLAIIPVLIVIIALGNVPSSSNSLITKTGCDDAQDAFDVLADYQDENKPVMQAMVDALEVNEDENRIKKAESLIKPFLCKYLAGKSFELTETSQLNGTIIASQGNVDLSPNIQVASKNWGNYAFQLRVGS